MFAFATVERILKSETLQIHDMLSVGGLYIAGLFMLLLGSDTSSTSIYGTETVIKECRDGGE